MSEELAVYEDKPLSAAEIKSQVNLIQEVMRAVFQEGQHYGKIPGAGDKPTLLKAGAEKILATFGLAVDPVVEDMSSGDVIRYRVKVRLTTKSGRFVGAGLGECSSEEEKYKWRTAVHDNEYNATLETHRRVKYKKDGASVKQVRTNPYDLANTILKMAKKRAQIDATLTVTAASDIFTQDIEDMPEEYINQKTDRTERQDGRQHHKQENKPNIKDPGAPATEAQIKAIYAICRSKGYDNDDDIILEVNSFLNQGDNPDFVPIESTKELSKGQASEFINWIQHR